MLIDSENIEKNLLLDIVKPGEKEILEIGCGGGRQAIYLFENTKKYVAIDLSEELINENKSKYFDKNILFEQGDSSNLKYEDSSFDIVFMMLCFHEIDNSIREKAINEIHRVLRKNGRAIIIDPIYPSCKFQSLFDFNQKKFNDFDHPAQVKESNDLIEKYIKKGDFVLEKTIDYKVDYIFENYDELFSILIEDAQEIHYSPNLEERKRIISEFLDNVLCEIGVNKLGKIKIFDCLSIKVLQK
jgi:SAM-dependent methyltransferase